jgi:alkylation response protein AidB-like acyl-CoA dehydrogenase
MPVYTPPLAEIRFVIKALIGTDRLSALPGYAAVNDELIDAILEEAGKVAGEVFAPLNHPGDKTGAKFHNGQVTMPPGCREAYQAHVQGGWNALAVDEAHGGQGLPTVMGMAVQELWQSANLPLALCTLLNQGAIELLASHGSDELKARFLPQLVSGEWTGTMNLTEPQAGSDVGAVSCKAIPEGDHYRIIGQKIYISYGDHDLADNIIHFVLARLPDAPEGSRGLSLFLVPKLMPDGSVNDVQVVSIEHKLGQHASPTCTMAYGDRGGAIGYLVGDVNGGIAAMFTMMNNARIGVGVQGLGLMERALQAALDYAATRVQSRAIDRPKAPPVPINQHPDVRRMLLLMQSQTEAARALAYHCAIAIDVMKRTGSTTAAQRVDLLTPIVKAWLTDLANEITSLAVQVYGGMGYVEETGVAQYMRDARVLAIYEGTNGIQANDLVFRKLARDDGAAFKAMLAEIADFLPELAVQPGDDCAVMHAALTASLNLMQDCGEWLIQAAKSDPALAAAGAASFLRLMGNSLGGFYLFKGAALAQQQLASPDADHDFLTRKLITARFYAEQVMVMNTGLAAAVMQGGRTIVAARF